MSDRAGGALLRDCPAFTVPRLACLFLSFARGCPLTGRPIFSCPLPVVSFPCGCFHPSGLRSLVHAPRLLSSSPPPLCNRGETAAEKHPSRVWPRIVKPPSRQKGIIRFGLCPPDENADGGVQEAVSTVVEVKRSRRLGRHVWRDARKRQWGDLLPPEDVVHTLGEEAEAAREAAQLDESEDEDEGEGEGEAAGEDQDGSNGESNGEGGDR